mmetsp:Transcript_11475/g.30460  ORF Transcript_11475/g.30460 Transcript_11475/m.30460 type:complete len:160 (-) Transcript_11475:3347-3826(-)
MEATDPLNSVPKDRDSQTHPRMERWWEECERQLLNQPVILHHKEEARFRFWLNFLWLLCSAFSVAVLSVLARSFHLPSLVNTCAGSETRPRTLVVDRGQAQTTDQAEAKIQVDPPGSCTEDPSPLPPSPLFVLCCVSIGIGWVFMFYFLFQMLRSTTIR